MTVSSEAAKKFCDDKIAGLLAETERFKAIRVALEDDAFTEQFAKLFVPGTNGSAPGKRAGKATGRVRATGNRQKIMAYLKSVGNAWTSAPEIVHNTKLHRGIVSNIFYKTNRGDFEAKDHPENSRMKLWRIKNPD